MSRSPVGKAGATADRHRAGALDLRTGPASRVLRDPARGRVTDVVPGGQPDHPVGGDGHERPGAERVEGPRSTTAPLNVEPRAGLPPMTLSELRQTQ